MLNLQILIGVGRDTRLLSRELTTKIIRKQNLIKLAKKLNQKKCILIMGL